MTAARREGGNPLAAFGEWLAETPREWPAEALDAARNAFVDVIGVAIPGAAEPVVRKVLATVSEWGAGPCTAIGARDRLAAPWAALVNGTAAHALDFDDNFDPAKAHASAVLAPAILALAEQEDAGGAACLDAFIAGLQILGRVGQGLNPYHRNRGWHATATVGSLGAAAACARLLGLPARQAAHALSIATSMSAGFMSQFGTMTKPVHAGLAAKAGVVAAGMARNGIEAGMDTLDGPTGMQRLMVGPDFEALRDGLTHVEHGQTMRFETADVGEPLLILSSGLKVKRFPNCGSAHRAMDGLLALRDEMGFAAGDIARIKVSAPVSHLNNLMYRVPESGAQARFSLEYGLAMIALKGQCSLADFDDAAIADPRAGALYPLIERNPVDKAEGEFPTVVEVELGDGRTGEIAMEMPVGSIAAPLTDEQFRAKFAQCADGHLPREDVARLQDMIGRMGELRSIRPLMDLLSR
jgi:2-methylcitrate dehydratase PrpD